ncbi:MAG: zinc ribbon domain-containing protein [Armatimonadetes bacterium]|nr:zinc ribbon domain-containing protein [Armatimonadota bacterium]MDE2205538.1 zinc ribbon domain-containing protein [Armatimonadota bacterium]
METETTSCPNCGAANPVGRSLCRQCSTPLTAYAGQLRDESLAASGALASQVEQLEERPAGVVVACVTNLVYVVLIPLVSLFVTLVHRPAMRADSSNYIFAAVGTVATIAHVVILVPFILFVLALSWFVWTQHEWAWPANWAMPVLFAVTGLLRFSGSAITGGFWMLVALVITVAWTRPSVKAWYGRGA